MLKQSKRRYLTPMVEQMEARVERGFAGSGTSSDSQPNSSTEEVGFSGNSYNGYAFN